MLVCNGNEIDLLVPRSVDDGEREARNQTFAKSSGHERAGTRRPGDALCRLFNGDKKPEPKSAEARFIELRARVKFRPG